MISKLIWNKAWPGLGQPHAQDDEAIVKDYARLVSEVNGVRGVWAQFEGRELAVLTLIDDDRGVESRVYQTEATVHDRWPGALINFQVYRDEESLSERVRRVLPILIEA
jgi:hypothetical protein